eukprot:COSAG01_NODE_6666_length_3555_cov_93.549479_3_plen_60_part_00
MSRANWAARRCPKYPAADKPKDILVTNAIATWRTSANRSRLARIHVLLAAQRRQVRREL